MKRKFLSILYPFWLFFGKTWLGNIIAFCFCLASMPFIVLTFDSYIEFTFKEESAIVKVVSLIIALVGSAMMSMGFIVLSDRLNKYYEKYDK